MTRKISGNYFLKCPLNLSQHKKEAEKQENGNENGNTSQQTQTSTAWKSYEDECCGGCERDQRRTTSKGICHEEL